MKANQIISEGTLKLEDLLPRLVEALRDDDDKEVVKEVNALTHDLPIFFPDARSWWDGEDPHFLYEQLTDIAQSIAAPFCYFGSHPGDGACIG